MRQSPTASDVIRSMMREGYSREEIYDVLSGAGFPGEHVQLLIDRVAAEFREVYMEPKPSRLAAKVEEVFGRKFEELSHVALSRVDSLAHRLELLRTEIEKLGRRVVGLQQITHARTFSCREKRKFSNTKNDMVKK